MCETASVSGINAWVGHPIPCFTAQCPQLLSPLPEDLGASLHDLFSMIPPNLD